MSVRRPTGLRERKKQATRLAISDVATRLFIARGFDAVTVAEVAEAANVSVNTIFNYFATKEELFFDRGEELLAAPSQVIRERAPGQSAVAALHQRFRGLLADEEGLLFRKSLRRFVATIEASPALKARERLLADESQARLAATLRAESADASDEATAAAAAAMVAGLWWLLLQEFRVRLLRGDDERQTHAALSRLGERGFTLLAAGVGDYCTRPAAASAAVAASAAPAKRRSRKKSSV